MAAMVKSETPRRVILAQAVRALRKHINTTQAAFARELNVDAGTVSRWEREDLAPTAKKCQVLAALARKHKMHDLAEAFLKPADKWKVVLGEGEVGEGGDAAIITMVEIVVLNRHVFLPDDYEGQRLCQELVWLVQKIEGRLFDRVRAGEELVLLDDAQKRRWLKVLEARGYAPSRLMTPMQIEKRVTQLSELGEELQRIFRKVEEPDGEASR